MSETSSNSGTPSKSVQNMRTIGRKMMTGKLPVGGGVGTSRWKSEVQKARENVAKSKIESPPTYIESSFAKPDTRGIESRKTEGYQPQTEDFKTWDVRQRKELKEKYEKEGYEVSDVYGMSTKEGVEFQISTNGRKPSMRYEGIQSSRKSDVSQRLYRGAEFEERIKSQIKIPFSDLKVQQASGRKNITVKMPSNILSEKPSRDSFAQGYFSVKDVLADPKNVGRFKNYLLAKDVSLIQKGEHLVFGTGETLAEIPSFWRQRMVNERYTNPAIRKAEYSKVSGQIESGKLGLLDTALAKLDKTTLAYSEYEFDYKTRGDLTTLEKDERKTTTKGLTISAGTILTGGKLAVIGGTAYTGISQSIKQLTEGSGFERPSDYSTDFATGSLSITAFGKTSAVVGSTKIGLTKTLTGGAYRTLVTPFTAGAVSGGTYESSRQYIRGEKFDIKKIQDTALTGGVYGVAFSVGGKAISRGFESVKPIKWKIQEKFLGEKKLGELTSSTATKTQYGYSTKIKGIGTTEFVDEHTIPSNLKYLQKLEGQKVTGIHMSEHPLLRKSLSTQQPFKLVGVPSSAGGLRQKYGLFHFYISGRETPTAYLGYTPRLSTTTGTYAPPKFNIKDIFSRKPQTLAYVQDVVDTPSQIYSAKTIQQASRIQASYPSRIQIPTENIFGLSKESQFIIPAEYTHTVTGKSLGTTVTPVKQGFVIFKPATKQNLVERILAPPQAHKIDVYKLDILKGAVASPSSKIPEISSKVLSSYSTEISSSAPSIISSYSSYASPLVPLSSPVKSSPVSYSPTSYANITSYIPKPSTSKPKTFYETKIPYAPIQPYQPKTTPSYTPIYSKSNTPYYPSGSRSYTPISPTKKLDIPETPVAYTNLKKDVVVNIDFPKPKTTKSTRRTIKPKGKLLDFISVEKLIRIGGRRK